MTNLKQVLDTGTPITTALAISLCIAAYWTGRLSLQVEKLEEYSRQEAEGQKKIVEIQAELTTISRDNSRRIEWLEQNKQ